MDPRPTIRDLNGSWSDRADASANAKAEESRDRARELRGKMLLPEVLLWQQLRGRKLDGHKFRRQHVLGSYFADFYCHELRLVVEVDGFDSHRHRTGSDSVRDEWMKSRGLSVLRLGATLVLDNMPRALWLIAERAKELRAAPGAECDAGQGTSVKPEKKE